MTTRDEPATATDRQRVAIALRAAAYMRWIETRQQRTPGPKERDAWIGGLLEAEGLDACKDEIYLTELLALTMDIEVVEHFISSNGYFRKLDEAAAQYRNQK